MTLLLLALLAVIMSYSQSNNRKTQISYYINGGRYYPISGRSFEIVGSAELNDSTLKPENISFKVPLRSFTGTYAGYLGLIGRADRYPDLEFKGKKVIVHDDGTFTIIGDILFRGTYAEQQIRVTEKITANLIIISGTFFLNSGDYIPGKKPSKRLVPTWIPIHFNLVFDKPAITS